MLRLFFNRASPIVSILELLGLTGMITAIVSWFQDPSWNIKVLLFGIMLFFYLFIRICYLIRWYPDQGRDIGIEVHFKKCLVPTSYIITVMMLGFLPSWETPFLVLANLLLSIIVFVNGIIIGFHFKDKETLPINALSLKGYNDIPHPKEYRP